MSTPTRTIQPNLKPLHRAIGHLFGPINPFLIATFQETKADRAVVAAVRLARAAATDNPRSVRVALQGGRISLLENQLGEPFEMESLPISSGSGELTCNLNCDYLLDVLTSLDGETVEFGGTDQAKPITIQQDQFLAVIMPMRG